MLAGHPRELTGRAVWLRTQASLINIWSLIMLGLEALGPCLFHCFGTLQVAGWYAGTASWANTLDFSTQEPGVEGAKSEAKRG